MGNTSSGGNFPGNMSMSEITRILGEASKKTGEDVKDAMDKLEKNPDDPALLINVQMKMGIWSSVTSSASSAYSTIKDMLSSIAQKI